MINNAINYRHKSNFFVGLWIVIFSFFILQQKVKMRYNKAGMRQGTENRPRFLENEKEDGE